MTFKNQESESPPNEAHKHEEKSIRFRVVYAFDVSQTDGEPLPECAKVTGDPREDSKRLKGLGR